jgi:hypothetical protein
MTSFYYYFTYIGGLHIIYSKSGLPNRDYLKNGIYSGRQEVITG